MGASRLETTGPDRSASVEGSPYVGKRAARVTAPEERPATPYVGKRAARPAEPVPAPVPEPVPYVGRRIARPAPTETAAAVPAPRAPMEWGLFAAESPEDTGQLPYALTDDFTGSLPKLTDEMLYGEPGTDFSYDTTATLPAARAGKRRSRKRTGIKAKGLPALPALAGLAVMAVAGFGAVNTGHAPTLVAAEAAPLRQANAMTGTAAVAAVGMRKATLSRSSDREDDPEAAAADRATALAGYKDQAGAWSENLKANQWQLPVTFGVYRLTARFGQYGLWSSMHTGLDFACGVGTPIHAVANGTISSAQYDGAYGNKTVETLEDGTEIWYAHQSAFNVKPGQVVHAGEIIGYVGATGHVTGPHVHIEVRPGGGDPIDPYSAMVNQGLTLE
ncbi:M23 family metallopeptidase [Nocardioides sp.]|uniref:M23 family metallopeptidase n=1 Tax=Nocardioides sp. TaxID=35761 RepID=UPI0039E2E700